MYKPVERVARKKIWLTYKMWFYLFTTALTFFLLVPGVLVTIPAGGSKITVAAVHAVVFAIVHKLVHKYVLKY